MPKRHKTRILLTRRRPLRTPARCSWYGRGAAAITAASSLFPLLGPSRLSRSCKSLPGYKNVGGILCILSRLGGWPFVLSMQAFQRLHFKHWQIDVSGASWPAPSTGTWLWCSRILGCRVSRIMLEGVEMQTRQEHFGSRTSAEIPVLQASCLILLALKALVRPGRILGSSQRRNDNVPNSFFRGKRMSDHPQYLASTQALPSQASGKSRAHAPS